MSPIDARYSGLLDKDVKAFQNLTVAQAHNNSFGLFLYKETMRLDPNRLRVIDGDIDQTVTDFRATMDEAKRESPDPRAAALSRELDLARADGSLRHFLARLSRVEVLVIDDRAMAPLTQTERRGLWEICEDRYQARSTLLTSQLPVARWHEQIGDPTIADGTLDRPVHNAHRIEMRGESMRKKRNPPSEENQS